jgi:hypothetical protein
LGRWLVFAEGVDNAAEDNSHHPYDRFRYSASSAGADDCAKHVNASAVVYNVHRGRERFQVDHQTLECGQGTLGQAKGKVGRLPAAVERAEAERQEELVISRDVHDRLTMVLGLL